MLVCQFFLILTKNMPVTFVTGMSVCLFGLLVCQYRIGVVIERVARLLWDQDCDPGAARERIGLKTGSD